MTLDALAKTLWKWLPDLLAMPTRIRKLSDAAEAEADKRLMCLSCGAGRVSRFRSESMETGLTRVIGTCDQCNLHWAVDVKSHVLIGPLIDQAHAASSLR